MAKITEFAKIPPFTAPGRYHVDMAIPYLIEFLNREIEESGLNMRPDFQREHVWTKKQQIAYIVFLLRKGSSGRDLYFNNPSWHSPVEPGAYNEFVCVDGLQRITAIRAFVEDQFPVYGSYFSEFTDRRHLTLNTLRVHINDLQTRNEVLSWYIEMNTGGTPHTKQQIEKVRSLISEN